MVIASILEFVGRIFDVLLSMLGLSASVPTLPLGPNSLRVFIKYSGKTVQVDLDPSWTVSRVKSVVAPKLGCSPDEIKIIFAGNELPDEFVLESCDVGQQSYLHAVRVQIRSKGGQSNNDSTNIEATEESGSASSSLASAFAEGTSSGPSCPLADRTRTFSKSLNDDDILNLITDSMASTGGDELAESTSEEQDEDWVKVSHPPGGSQTKSDFFVYCGDPDCSDLKEGKLRVRCAQCLSGAITVKRHPQGWSDVLEPRQVEGSCEEGCENSYAQFYFKCSSHVTKGEDDSSPPLPQIKRNSEAVPCLACGDAKELVFLFPCAKSHVTCIECFKGYMLTKLSHREFIQDEAVGYTLGCPALCENSLIKDPHHFKLVGKAQYERYQRFGTEECLLQMGGLFCPQPDCGMGIIPADEGCLKIACLHGCGYVFCRRCLEGWHIGSCRHEGNPSASAEDCSTGGYRSAGYFVSEDRAAAAQWGDATRRAMRLSTKPCPNCRVPTERDGGCMHMECTKCKFQWCWVCQTKWTRDCMGNHWFG